MSLKMKIPERIVILALPKGTKKITTKVLTALGLWFDGDDYIVENQDLFEQKVWCCLEESQKIELLLNQQLKYEEELSEIKSSLAYIQNRLDNLRIITSNYNA